jgi:hypothetical protein
MFISIVRLNAWHNILFIVPDETLILKMSVASERCSTALTVRHLVIAFVGCVTCALTAAAQATDDPSARMIALNGQPMRAWTAGLESRQASQPVVILEAVRTASARRSSIPPRRCTHRSRQFTFRHRMCS